MTIVGVHGSPPRVPKSKILEAREEYPYGFATA